MSSDHQDDYVTVPEKKKGVFIRIPGNGNRMIQTVVDWYPDDIYFDHHVLYSDNLARAMEATKLIGTSPQGGSNWDKCYSFAIIRNPYERLVNVYNQLFDTPLDRQSQERLYPFDKFVDDLCNKRLSESVTKKTNPQCNHIVDENGELIVDQLLRYEHLHEDFNKVITALDLPTSISIPYKVEVADFKKSYFSNKSLIAAMNFYKSDYLITREYFRKSKQNPVRDWQWPDWTPESDPENSWDSNDEACKQAEDDWNRRLEEEKAKPFVAPDFNAKFSDPPESFTAKARESWNTFGE